MGAVDWGCSHLKFDSWSMVSVLVLKTVRKSWAWKMRISLMLPWNKREDPGREGLICDSSFDMSREVGLNVVGQQYSFKNIMAKNWPTGAHSEFLWHFLVLAVHFWERHMRPPNCSTRCDLCTTQSGRTAQSQAFSE